MHLLFLEVVMTANAARPCMYGGVEEIMKVIKEKGFPHPSYVINILHYLHISEHVHNAWSLTTPVKEDKKGRGIILYI